MHVCVYVHVHTCSLIRVRLVRHTGGGGHLLPRATDAGDGDDVHGPLLHGRLRAGDVAQVGGLRLQEILHRLLVLARLRHRHGVYGDVIDRHLQSASSFCHSIHAYSAGKFAFVDVFWENYAM